MTNGTMQQFYAEQEQGYREAKKHTFFCWLDKLPADREPWIDEIRELEITLGITPEDYRAHQEAKAQEFNNDPLPF